MAVNVSTWVWQLDLPPYEKMVLLELADHADTKGHCWPKQETVAKRTGISRGAVNRIIKRLTTLGLLTQEQRRINGYQRSSMYRLSIGTVIYLSDTGSLCGVTQDHSTECSEVTHSETSVETSVETSNCGDQSPPEISSVKKVKAGKMAEINLNPKKSKSEIFEKAKRYNGNLTVDGCGYLWRHCRGNAADDNGFQAELTRVQKTMLRNAYLRVGGAFPEIVWAVMSDWVAFTKHAQVVEGAFSLPLNPSVPFFVKYIESAAGFSVEDEEEYGVKLTAIKAKPLTNTNGKSHNPSNAASIKDVQAIAEKYDL